MLDGERNTIDGSKISESLRNFMNFDVGHGETNLEFPLRHRQLHIRRHSDSKPPVLIINAQSDFECFDVALRPADIALCCETGVYSPVENRAAAHFVCRQADSELVTDPGFGRFVCGS